MGQSTDAILFYGILMGEDDPLEDEDDFKDWLCQRLEGPPEPEWDSDRKEFNGSLSDYWTRRDAFFFEAGVGGVELDFHCSGNYPMYYLAGHKIRASRGYPEAVDPETLAGLPDDVMRARIAKVAALLGVEPEEPGWHLVSLWH